jgi:spore maturation protein CgeB
MRWLIVHPGPGFSVADVYTGWVEGLRAIGETVSEFNLGDRLAFYDSVLLPLDDDNRQFRKALTGEQAIELAVNGLAASLFKVRPDVLLLVSGFFTDVAILEQARQLGTKVVVLNTECPYEDDRQLKLAEHADLALVNDPVSVDRFAEVTKTVYTPHAFRPQVHHPGHSRYPACDFAFVGTGYPSRMDFLSQMDLSGVDVLLAGHWSNLPEDSPLRQYLGHAVNECCDNHQAAELYRTARVGMNLYRREANDAESTFGVAMGPREVEMAACGLFFLRDPRQESDEVLGMLPSFTNPGEAGELLRWYLKHGDARCKLAESAREAVQDRTFTNHATRLLRLFERQPVSA